MVIKGSDRPEAEGGHAAPSVSTTYYPPTLRYLGTLRELTQGGAGSTDDGMGGSGDSGSLG